ncbi:MAG: hypothetical protein ACTSQE_06045 [Candidatus Heimdallarchaeaceae archaeon]
MKRNVIYSLFVFTFILLFLTPLAVQSSSIEFSGKKIAIDISHFPVHVTFDDFESIFSEAGNTVDQIENFTDINSYDILLIPGSRINYSTSDMSVIQSWFEQPDKLLWVAGDSDYSGLFLSHVSLNPLLEYLGSQLRLDSGAVSDLESNDGTGYRVIATKPGNGPIGSKVNEDVHRLLLHGPTAIYGVQDGNPVDLRFEELPNVEVLFSYNDSAEMLDQDYSDLPSDFYKIQEVEGSYPAVVVEKLDSSTLIVSGEALFSSYKNMYGEVGEHDSEIQGKLFVNNLFNYFFKPRGTSFNSTSAMLSIIITATSFLILKKKVKKS